MRIIVTGGAGFLGSNLCKKLLEQNHEVICLDNLITGYTENIEEFKKNPNFKFIEHDITKPLSHPELVSGSQKIDQIYHLASPASPNKDNPKSYQALPFQTMGANTAGTWNVCDFAINSGAKLVFASTSEVYGDPKEHPQKESYRGNVSTTGPRAVYDEAKRFGETIVSAFVRHQNMKGTIVRIFNTYGPKMADDGRVVITFIKAALENKPLPVFGDGKQTRSFMYIDDLVDGLIAAMEKGKDGEVYNIGNPKEFTILELAQKVKELSNSTSEVDYHDFPEDDPMQRCPDISKSKSELVWEPQISLDQGLIKLIAYLGTGPKH